MFHLHALILTHLAEYHIIHLFTEGLMTMTNAFNFHGYTINGTFIKVKAGFWHGRAQHFTGAPQCFLSFINLERTAVGEHSLRGHTPLDSSVQQLKKA